MGEGIPMLPIHHADLFGTRVREWGGWIFVEQNVNGAWEHRFGHPERSFVQRFLDEQGWGQFLAREVA